MRTLSVVIAVLLLIGCGRTPETVVDPGAVSPSVHSRADVELPDSPKLRRLGVRTVELRDVPLEEVTSPGKIEVNPNRLAHIALPVAGRVASVQVRSGRLCGKAIRS
jgi:cobalt-zinc-cadmium efflux system membrane fusion protein